MKSYWELGEQIAKEFSIVQHHNFETIKHSNAFKQFISEEMNNKIIEHLKDITWHQVVVIGELDKRILYIDSTEVMIEELDAHISSHNMR